MRENGLFTCVLSSFSSSGSIEVREQQAPLAAGGLRQDRSQMVLTLSQTIFFWLIQRVFTTTEEKNHGKGFMSRSISVALRGF